MGNKSKAARACLENLTKASAKVYKAIVEECSDSEDPHCQPGPDNDMWDLATVSDSSDGGECLRDNVAQEAFHITFEGENLDTESDEDGSEFDEADIADDARLLTFSNILAQAQAASVEAEKRADASKKRRKPYKGNSGRSQHRFRASRRAIAAGGKQTFISSWLTTMQKRPSIRNEETEGEIIPLLPAPASVSKTLSVHDQ